MITFSQKHRQLRIDTPLGEDALLLQHMSGVESLSEPFQYQATVMSKDSSVDGNELIGKRVSVSYFCESGRVRTFNGFVSNFRYAGQVEEPVKMTAYELTIVPWLWFLSQNRDCQIFQDMTTPDIIKKIFAEFGFNDFQLKLSGSYPTREYCVQYRESDFAFVSRLMEEEGICYYFEHSADKHTLILSDSNSGYFTVDEDVIHFKERGQDHHSSLTSWAHNYSFRPGSYAQRDFNFKAPADPLKTERVSGVTFDLAPKCEIYEYPGYYDESPKGDRLTQVRAECLATSHDTVSGSGYHVNFSPGGKFRINEHVRSEDAQTYVITSVSTTMHNNLGIDASEEVDFQNSFTCISADTIFRPARLTPKPRIEGPQTAIVTTDGQEIVVDEYARVKVQFHWDRYGQKDVNSSCWIRVAQHHAGGSWGMIDIPRQHEEVIVSFLNGDPDRPIITGRVYNGDNRSPFDLKGAGNNAKNKKRRGYITKSYEDEGYNELTMDDTAGEEQVRIHAQYNMDTTVLNDSKERIYGNRHQIIGWEKDGNKGGDQNEMVYQDKNLNIKRHQSEHIEGNAQLMVGNGDADDGGRMDIVIENQEVKRVGNGGVHLDTSGPHVSLITGNESREVGGNYMHKVAGNIGIESGMTNEIHIKAGTKIVLESGMLGGISIKGPGGFISIDQTGVTIQGMMVKINSGGSAQSGGGCSVDSVESVQEAAPAEPEVADRFRE